MLNREFRLQSVLRYDFSRKLIMIEGQTVARFLSCQFVYTFEKCDESLI